MSAEDLEKYETEMELQLYREYRDIVRQFSYVVETERRFYLANQVDLHVRNSDGEVYFEVEMHDAWVWDMYLYTLLKLDLSLHLQFLLDLYLNLQVFL